MRGPLIADSLSSFWEFAFAYHHANHSAPATAGRSRARGVSRIPAGFGVAVRRMTGRPARRGTL